MSPPKRKPGRPEVSKERARLYPLQIRLTADERRGVKRAAAADDATVSAWVRALIAAALQRGGAR